VKLKIFSVKPSGRKVFSDLWGNKVRTGLVVASIAVGVFAVGMIAGAYVMIPGNMNSSFAAANPANIDIRTAPFDTDLLTSIRRVDGVEDAQGSRTLNVRLNTGPDAWTSMDVIAISDFSASRINAQIPIAGVNKPAKQEIVLEKKAAEKYGLHPGDTLQIELFDGTMRQLPVVGITQDVTSGIGGMLNNTRGYVTYDSLEWLHASQYYDQLLVSVSRQPNDSVFIQQVSDRVVDKLKKGGREAYRIALHEKNKHPMDSILQAVLRILLVLGILIVFLSGSLISNTLTALLIQHLPQIGIMKLVGARSAQIRKLYLVLILAFGCLALVIGIPAGSWAAYALSAFAASLIGFPINGFQIIPSAVAIQVAIGLAVPLLAGYPSIVNGARVTVHKAINGGGLTDTLRMDKHWFDRWLARLRGVSRPALVSIRNTFRRKGRLALTLFTLTLGGAIFISVFNVQVSLNYKTDQITKYFGADVNLDFSHSYLNSQVEMTAQAIPGISAVEPWVITQGDILKADGTAAETITLIAPPAGSALVKPVLLDGRWLMAGDKGAITVNEAFLKKFPGLRVGDSLHLKINGRKADWQIVGLFQFTGEGTLIAYTTYDYLSQYINQPGRTANYRIVSSDHSIDSQIALSKSVDAYFRERGFKVNNVEAGGSFTRSVTEYIGILTAFLVIMALLTAAVGSIGMAGTLSMNVMERTREIGILRAIGAYDRVILRLVLLEGLIIGAISFLFGALLSFPITTLLSEVISQAIFNSPAKFAFTVQGFIIWLVVVIVLSALSSLVPARSASRMTIREVLAYE
jgi:putative ABC transport system permease protein